MMSKEDYDIAISVAETYMMKAEDYLRKVLRDIRDMDEDTFRSVETRLMGYNTIQKYNYDNVKKSINMWIAKRNKEIDEKVHENEYKVHSEIGEDRV